MSASDSYLSRVWMGSQISAKVLPTRIRHLSAHIKLPENCQARCISCDYWKTRWQDSIDTDWAIDLVNQISGAGICSLRLTGGEPLLRKDKFQVLKQANTSSFKNIIIQTTRTHPLWDIWDLTLESFGYLRLPLAIAAAAFLAATFMMLSFFHAARIALVVFDPCLSSRPLDDVLLHSPEGRLIVDHHYFPYSPVLFYANREALLLNGRRHNMENGAAAPRAAAGFIDDTRFKDSWLTSQRWYIVTDPPA